MRLQSRILTQTSGALELNEGAFYASCFGTRVPDDLVAAITVHGSASNDATAGFASTTRSQPSMPLAVEHWDGPPPPAGEWQRVLRTRLLVDTSGTVEFFSRSNGAPTAGTLEFPIARGYYEVEASATLSDDGVERWRVRIFDSPEFGPELSEVAQIARRAR